MLTIYTTGYLLTFKEARYGTPERPLSKLGAIAYGRYWQLAVYKVLRTADPDGDLRMEEICRQTRMTLEDVFNTLRTHGLISLTVTPSTPQNGRALAPSTPVHRNAGVARKNLIRKNSSNPKLHVGSQSGVSVYDLTSIPTHYTIHWDRRVIREFLEKIEAKGLAKLRPEKLRWSPYLIGRVRRSDLGSGEAGRHWELELEDIPEPSMHSHTPLEPVEKPPPPPRANSGLKTPKRNGTLTSGSRPGSTARVLSRREGSPVTSAGQPSVEDWQEEPMDEEDDDEFRDDASTSPELRRPARHRSSGVFGRLLTRRSRTTDEEPPESEADATWKDSSNAPLRTRSGKILASVSADSDSDWEHGAARRRTRSKSHATRSTRRGESLAPSHSASGSEFQDEANVQEQLGLEDSPRSIMSRILPSPAKKRAKRVITSDSGDDVANGDDQGWPHSAEPMVTNGHIEEGDATPHMQLEVHGHANGVASDDQSPETPRVFSLEEQNHVGTSELQGTHQQSDGAFEWVQSSYNAQAPQFHHLDLGLFGSGNGFRPIDTNAAPLLHTVDKVVPIQQRPSGGSVDGAAMEIATHHWPNNENAADAMDTCDEDAEGEDEDAEGEEDLTLMV